MSADVVQLLHLLELLLQMQPRLQKIKCFSCEWKCLLLKINWGEMSQVKQMAVVQTLTYTPVNQSPNQTFFPGT